MVRKLKVSRHSRFVAWTAFVPNMRRDEHDDNGEKVRGGPGDVYFLHFPSGLRILPQRFSCPTKALLWKQKQKRKHLSLNLKSSFHHTFFEKDDLQSKRLSFKVRSIHRPLVIENSGKCNKIFITPSSRFTISMFYFWYHGKNKLRLSALTAG